MKFNELITTKQKQKKRVGRGISAGGGKTAGRGTKGQKSRTGSSIPAGFAGGQNPLMQQLPKLPGFKSHFVKAENVSTIQISTLKAKIIDSTILAEAKLISNPYVLVKLLFDGPVDKQMTVKLPGASQKALDAIEEAGGTFEKVEQLKRPKTANNK